MIQEFEIFKGAPDALVAKLEALKTAGNTINQVVLTTAAAQYLIIYSHP